MELGVFARRPPSLRCRLGTLVLALPVAPQASLFWSHSASTESVRQPEFLLVSGIGLALNLDHALSVHWLRPRPTGPIDLVPCFPSVPWPDPYTIVPAPRM